MEMRGLDVTPAVKRVIAAAKKAGAYKDGPKESCNRENCDGQPHGTFHLGCVLGKDCTGIHAYGPKEDESMSGPKSASGCEICGGHGYVFPQVDSPRIEPCVCSKPTPQVQQAPWGDGASVAQEDLRRILVALGLGDHARPISPHAVVENLVLPTIQRQVAALESIASGEFKYTAPDIARAVLQGGAQGQGTDDQ